MKDDASEDVYTPYQVGALRLTIAGGILAIWGIPSLFKIPKNKLKYVGKTGCSFILLKTIQINVRKSIFQPKLLSFLNIYIIHIYLTK